MYMQDPSPGSAISILMICAASCRLCLMHSSLLYTSWWGTQTIRVCCAPADEAHRLFEFAVHQLVRHTDYSSLLCTSWWDSHTIRVWCAPSGEAHRQFEFAVHQLMRVTDHTSLLWITRWDSQTKIYMRQLGWKLTWFEIITFSY